MMFLPGARFKPDWGVAMEGQRPGWLTVRAQKPNGKRLVVKSARNHTAESRCGFGDNCTSPRWRGEAIGLAGRSVLLAMTVV